MSDSSPLPPVRLHSEAELARDALATPLLSRAVRLARWAGPDTRVGAGGELVEEQLPAAAAELGLDGGDAAAYASEAWRVAVDTGLVEVADEEEGTVTAGADLALVLSGAPQDVLGLWLGALETVLADASVPDLDDIVEAMGEGGEIDFSELDWDPEAEAEFLDGVLGNLYLLTSSEDGPGDGPVPLPALAASMIVPDDMGEPTNDVLEQVSDAMMRLDDQFRLLEPIGLVDFQPVDEALMADADEEPAAPVDDTDVSRYGMVRLTPSGCTGSGRGSSKPGSPRPRWATSRTRGRTCCSTAPPRFRRPPRRPRPSSGSTGVNPWPRRGSCSRRRRAPTRGRRCGGCAASRLSRWSVRRPRPRSVTCSTMPSWVGSLGSGSPSGGLGRASAVRGDGVLADRRHDCGAAGRGGELRGVAGACRGACGAARGFFAAAWRVDHPATPDVLEAMGRLHPDKRVAKEARKAAFKARSQQGG